MDSLGLISSLASIILVGVLITTWCQSWFDAASNAQTELDTLVAEVISTRAALGPLERYVRVRSSDERSQRVILTMMADLKDLEDQLYAGIENHLGNKSLTFKSKLLWRFRRTSLKEIASRISTQKITILALQVAELTQQTVLLEFNFAGARAHRVPSNQPNTKPKHLCIITRFRQEQQLGQYKKATEWR